MPDPPTPSTAASARSTASRGVPLLSLAPPALAMGEDFWLGDEGDEIGIRDIWNGDCSPRLPSCLRLADVYRSHHQSLRLGQGRRAARELGMEMVRLNICTISCGLANGAGTGAKEDGPGDRHYRQLLSLLPPPPPCTPRLMSITRRSLRSTLPPHAPRPLRNAVIDGHSVARSSCYWRKTVSRTGYSTPNFTLLSRKSRYLQYLIHPWPMSRSA